MWRRGSTHRPLNFLPLASKKSLQISRSSPPTHTMLSSKRKTTSGGRDAPKRKKFKRQREYHSSGSESEPEPVQEKETVDAEIEEADVGEDQEEVEASENEDDTEIDSEDSGEDEIHGKRKKRNDPTIFATSISKILNSKLTTSKRADPVLSRSKDATDAIKEMAEARIEIKAKQKLRDEKRAKLENGRVKDVLGLNNTEVSTEDIIEQEKKYKKIAQRGVVRMFNAIRAAQVMGEQAAREAQSQGVVGIDKREQKVTEMSKKGFLELIAGGGKK
jgi:mitochondrial fusion and transport protein UGO1